jgi:hypothetical protein
MFLVTVIPFAGSPLRSDPFQNVVSAPSSLPFKRRRFLRRLEECYLGMFVGNGDDGMIMA